MVRIKVKARSTSKCEELSRQNPVSDQRNVIARPKQHSTAEVPLFYDTRYNTSNVYLCAWSVLAISHSDYKTYGRGRSCPWCVCRVWGAIIPLVQKKANSLAPGQLQMNGNNLNAV